MQSCVEKQLNALQIPDSETFCDYILQIVNEQTMEIDEKREAICDLLAEFADEPKTIEEIVDGLLQEWQLSLNEHLLHQQEERLKALALEKEREQQVLQHGIENQSIQPAALSKDERKIRQALIAQYGYDLDQVIEKDNGEVDILYKGSGSDAKESTSDLFKNSNAERVKEEEQNKRIQAQMQHQKVVARNKALLEKQRLAKDKEKQRTQKREKRRM